MSLALLAATGMAFLLPWDRLPTWASVLVPLAYAGSVLALTLTAGTTSGVGRHQVLRLCADVSPAPEIAFAGSVDDALPAEDADRLLRLLQVALGLMETSAGQTYGIAIQVGPAADGTRLAWSVLLPAA